VNNVMNNDYILLPANIRSVALHEAGMLALDVTTID